MQLLTTTNRRAYRVRRGATLIELLVVIVIMLSITAIAIPVIAPSLQGREIRESARLLDAAFSRARNRAVELGRPVGLSFERIAGLPWASRTVSLVETPEPYTGDYVGSTMDVDRYGVIWNMGWWQQDLLGNLGFNPDVGWMRRVAPAGFVNPAAQQRVGDRIKLGNKGFTYRIETGEPFVDANGNAFWDAGEFYIDSNFDGAYTPTAPGTVDPYGYFVLAPNPTASPPVLWRLVHDDPVRRGIPEFPVKPVQLFGSPPPVLNALRTPYQIQLSPVKALGGEFQLLDSALVDLEFSGTPGNLLTPDPFLTPSLPPTGVPKSTPVVVMFSSQGRLDTVSGFDPLLGREVRLKLHEPLYFLIGRRDQIRSDPNPGTLSFPNNLHDIRNTWVTVGPNGFICTAEAGQVTNQFAAASLPQLLLQLRQSRQYAEQAVATGGR